MVACDGGGGVVLVDDGGLARCFEGAVVGRRVGDVQG